MAVVTTEHLERMTKTVKTRKTTPPRPITRDKKTPVGKPFSGCGVFSPFLFV
jgi:hypothetical protein